MTDSLKIAETFGKRHADVLRSINSLKCSEEFRELNFALVDYTDAKGELRPKYYITQNGCYLLVMGYTGKDAAVFKESYIREFNHMRDQLQNHANVNLNMSEEDRAIAYFTKLKAEKELLLHAKQNKLPK